MVSHSPVVVCRYYILINECHVSIVYFWSCIAVLIVYISFLQEISHTLSRRLDYRLSLSFDI